MWEELKKIKDTPRHSLRSDAGQAKKKIDIAPAEKILAKLMMEDINIVKMVRGELSLADFKSQDIKNIAEALFSIDSEDGAVDIARLINCLGERVPQNVISCIVSEEVDMRDKDKNVSDCIMTIKRDNKNALLKDIQSRIHIAQKSGYEQEEKRLVGEFNQLIKRGL